MEISGTAIVLLVLLLLVILFFVGGCSLKCSQSGAKEGYTRSCLGNDCYGLQRTPVDYAEKYPHGWQRNPHYKAFPGDKHQPLDFGPIDLLHDGTRLAKHDGVLFQQYRGDWRGAGKGGVSLINDEKNRFDLNNVGDYGARVQLDDMYNPRFGPNVGMHTERSYDEPNPFFDKIYGGSAYLQWDKIGD